MEAAWAGALAAENSVEDDIFDSYCFVVGKRIQDGLSDTLEELSSLPDASWLGWLEVLESVPAVQRGSLTPADIRARLWKIKKEAERKMDEEEDLIEEAEDVPPEMQEALRQLRTERGWYDTAEVLLEAVELQVCDVRMGARDGRRAAEKEFRVTFAGYPGEDDVWVRQSKLQKCSHAKAAVEEFEARTAEEDRISAAHRIQQLDCVEPRTQEELETPMGELLDAPNLSQPDLDGSEPEGEGPEAVGGDAPEGEQGVEHEELQAEGRQTAHAAAVDTASMRDEGGRRPPSPTASGNIAMPELAVEELCPHLPSPSHAPHHIAGSEEPQKTELEREFQRHLSDDLWKSAVVEDVKRNKTNMVWFEVHWPDGLSAEVGLSDIEDRPECALKLLRFLLHKQPPAMPQRTP